MSDVLQCKSLWVDCECTGLDPKKHALIQLAGYIEIDGTIVERFEIKARPFKDQLVSREALEITGLTLEQLYDYPDHRESFHQFRSMLLRYVNKWDKRDKFSMYGFCALFDGAFIRAWFENHGDQYFGSLISFPLIDVAVLAGHALRRERHEMANFKLATVARQFGIEVDNTKTHEASYDLELTRLVYEKAIALERSAPRWSA